TAAARANILSSEREIERGPPLNLALDPYPPPVTLDNTLHDCTPDPGAIVHRLIEQPPEDRENLGGIFHVKAYTVVPDHVHRFSILLKRSYLNNCTPPCPGQLERVGYEVEKDLFYERRVPFA